MPIAVRLKKNPYAQPVDLTLDTPYMPRCLVFGGLVYLPVGSPDPTGRQTFDGTPTFVVGGPVSIT